MSRVVFFRMLLEYVVRSRCFFNTRIYMDKRTPFFAVRIDTSSNLIFLFVFLEGWRLETVFFASVIMFVNSLVCIYMCFTSSEFAPGQNSKCQKMRICTPGAAVPPRVGFGLLVRNGFRRKVLFLRGDLFK